jgi:hypothetical protein
LSQPFLDKHFGDQALEPHNEAAVVDIHTHPQHPTTDLTILRQKLAFSGKYTSAYGPTAGAGLPGQILASGGRRGVAC